MQLNINGPAPAWATGNHKKGPVRPSVSKFAKFAKLAAEHFAGRVDRYSVWNEPNWKSWLNPPSGNLYRSLYLKAYAADAEGRPGRQDPDRRDEPVRPQGPVGRAARVPARDGAA